MSERGSHPLWRPRVLLPSDLHAAPGRWAGDRDTGTHRATRCASPLGPSLPGGPLASSPKPRRFPALFPESPCWLLATGQPARARKICGALRKPAVWTPRTARRRRAPWLRVMDQPGRRETWVLEEEGEVSPLHAPLCPRGPRAGRAVCREPPAPAPLGPGTPAYPRRLVTRTHPGLQFMRKGGCGWAKGREGSLPSPWGESPRLWLGLQLCRASQADRRGYQRQLPAQPGHA